MLLNLSLFCFNMFLCNIWVKDSPTNTHFKAKLSGLAQRTPDTGNISTIKIIEDTYGNSNNISVDLFCLGDIFWGNVELSLFSFSLVMLIYKFLSICINSSTAWNINRQDPVLRMWQLEKYPKYVDENKPAMHAL